MHIRAAATVGLAVASLAVLGGPSGASAAAKGKTQQAVVTESRLLPNGDTATLTAVPLTLSAGSCTGCLLPPEPCGESGYAVTIKYKNYLGVVLWTYQQVVYAKFCSGLVTGVPTLYDRPVDSCCGWGWEGDAAPPWHSSLPYTSVQTFTEGHFRVCGIPYVLCDDKYPWIRVTIGYNGNIWADSWSTG